MNKEILLVVNYYNESIIDFEKQLKPTHEIFENIVICNKNNCDIKSNYPIFSGRNYDYLDQINNYIKKQKLNIKSIVFVDNINNIDNEDTIVLGSNENNNMSKDLINKIFNTLFNTNFKSVLPEIKAINIKLFNKLINNLKKDNNYMITVITENIALKENEINTIWRKSTNRVGKDSFKMLPYLKGLMPYIIKSIIPYLISYILFMIIFYLKSSTNDLEGIIFANLISEGVGIVLHIIINYNCIYKYNLVSRNILFLLKKIFRIILSCFFIYILYNLLNINLFVSKLLVDLILMIVIALIFTSVSKKE